MVAAVVSTLYVFTEAGQSFVDEVFLFFVIILS